VTQLPSAGLGSPYEKRRLSPKPGKRVAGSEQFDDDGIRLSEVAPKVIEDAMIATWKLGFFFLWMDRYCNPQKNALETRS
jgi:hypothetical protein